MTRPNNAISTTRSPRVRLPISRWPMTMRRKLPISLVNASIRSPTLPGRGERTREFQHAVFYGTTAQCSMPTRKFQDAPPLSSKLPILSRSVKVRPGMSKRFYLTTAIDYVNGEPHLGHAYEKIVADVIARVHRSLGEEVFFLTGLDEHGQKVQQSALATGKTPQEYCDDLAATWKRFAKELNLSNDDFVRTSEPRHKEVVLAILSRLRAGGHFYKAQYRGFYSLKEETFLTEKDRRPDGTFDPGYGEVVELVEDNYYFQLRQHQRWLIDHIESHPDFILPSQRRNEILGFLRHNELEDLCITRPRARLNWGIPLPFDEHFVTYVWFHALYWPIMLKAAGLPLPKQLLVHGWWQKDGEKMSKSTGNVVDPVTVIAEWGV